MTQGSQPGTKQAEAMWCGECQKYREDTPATHIAHDRNGQAHYLCARCSTLTAYVDVLPLSTPPLSPEAAQPSLESLIDAYGTAANLRGRGFVEIRDVDTARAALVARYSELETALAEAQQRIDNSRTCVECGWEQLPPLPATGGRDERRNENARIQCRTRHGE